MYERVLRSKIIFLKEEIDYEYDIAIPKLEKPKPRTWLCRKCRCEFKTRRLLDQHRKEAHWREDNDSQYKYTFNKDEDCYTCITCDVEIKSKEEIEEHVRTHDESYSCTTCDATFHSAYKYSVHMHKHCDDDLYRCPLCVYNTRRITSMLQHINRTHLKKYLYYCSYCGKGFGDVVVFREHENNHLGAKPFICVVCNKTFAFSRYLLLHQTRYHTVSIMGMLNKNQCKVCKKIFSRKTTLEKHIKRHDAKRPKQKIHLCDNCGKGYATKNKLELHYRVHTGYKPYMCSYCEKCFTKKEYLVMHERIHSGEKPYTCPFCVKCFNQDAPLRLHIRGHTGERPYSCHICKEGFISKAALKLHFKNCNG